MAATNVDPRALAFLAGGGKAAQIVAGLDWAATSLGPIGDWPESLRMQVGLVLRSPVPMVALWGADGVMIYNDAYSVVAGSRHPEIFGRKVREAWPEVADFNGKVMNAVLAGRTLSYRDEALVLQRNDGKPEHVWLNLDYAPLVDDAGRPAGVLGIVVETTAKVRAERRLSDERTRIRQLFEQAPGLMAMLEGPEHVFTLANAAYHELIGGRDLLGRPFSQALPEMVDQGFVTLLDRVLLTGEPYVGRAAQLILDRAPGTPPEERFVDFIYQPITTDDGEVTGVFVQGHDVTDQKRIDLALRESEARFRLVAESAPVMLWMGDVDGHCVYLNATQRAFWGVAPEAVEGFDWGTTVHPDDAEALAAPFVRAMRTHTAFTVESRLRRADGVYRDIVTSAQPRFDADGSFLGMIGVNVDTTETRLTEAAIRAESSRLATLNRTGAAIAAELEVERIVSIVCDACVALVGAEMGAFFYTVADAAGGRSMRYVHTGGPREAFAGFAMPRATEIFRPTFEGEGPVRSDDIREDPRFGRNAPYHGVPEGHPPVRSYLAVPVASRSGGVIGGLFFGHSAPGVFSVRHEEIVAGISGQAATAIDNARLFEAAERELVERRRAESALKLLNETLEQRVVDEVMERSRAEEALRQAQKMESIGKLTGGVAHDFNNLLQVISGNLQLLGRDLAGNERASGHIADALGGVERGAKLASQLLAFSRRQPLEPRVVDAGRLVTGMSDMLRRTIGDGIEVETMVAAGLWRSLVDPTQLEAAVLNLAINARDAVGEAGKITIELGNAVLDAAYVAGQDGVSSGDYVMLAVSDTGAGIPRELLDKVFEPFFSTKSPGRGTGLGLSMVYGFVKQSGGQVNIYSEPGHGTTVRLYLPRIDRNEDQPVATQRGPIIGGSETILVAEDDDAVRATVVELLGDLGYNVLTARDAQGALGVIESGVPIDLLFTDVVMPGKLRSPELARLARERQPEMAVLFTSGYTENSIVHHGRLDAGLELLTKPYSREALARKIRLVLGHGAPRRANKPVRAPGVAGLTVLLCEDDALIRLNTADLLQEAGMTVIETGTAAAALAALEEQRPDVFVIDVGLPDMTGVELATRIRARLPEAPVVFATGHLEVPGAEAMSNVETLRKPYDEHALCASVQRLVSAAGR